MTTPIIINNLSDLQAIQNNLSGYYVLGANIDAAGFSFTPIGGAANPFTGIFDGQGYTISNLTINNVSNTDSGLFGDIGAIGTVRNVGLINESVTSSSSHVGGLVGENFGTITQSYVEGNIGGASSVGGLVGLNASSGSISQSYATGQTATHGGADAGGLVGVNQGAISESYATGSVNPATVSVVAGGLVGGNSGSITQSYATGLVGGGGGFALGGLVGSEAAGTVTASYWDTQTTARSTSADGTGLTTAQLTSGILPAGFDPTIWLDNAGQFPELRWQIPTSTVVTYAYKTIDLGTSTAAFDINNLGQITGSYTDPKAHAFIYSISGAPLITKDEPLGFNGTDGYGINDAGQVVGDYADGFLNHAFFYAGGTTYSTLSGRFAWDINDVGQIVGDYAQYSSPTGTAFLRNSDGSYVDIRYSQSILTSAEGINNNGEVVGYFQDGTGYHGFTYLNGAYDTIPDAASKLADAAPNQTFATGVNDSGWIVGYYNDINGVAHSFLDINGTYQVIGNELHATGVFAQGINDAGQIVGYYNDASGTHAFLATISTNHPPVASNITANANEDTNVLPVTLTAFFTDADLSDTFTFSTDVTGTLGAVTNNHDGTFNYDPNGKFESLSIGDTATDIFTYTVTDNHGASSTATATVTIHGENDAPSALPDAMLVQNGAVVTANAAQGVLVNDSDSDKHDTLHVSKVNGLSTNVGHAIIGAYGTLTLNADGSYSYSANKNIPGLTNKGGVQDQFAYSVDDGHGGTASSTLTLTVQTQQALNHAPVLSINPLDANKDEGNSGTTPFTFVVTRDDNAAGTTSVDWTVGPANGVTADGADFIGGAFPTGTVTFDTGELSKTITVNVHGDMLYESNGKTENFVVALSNPSSGATISAAHGSAVGHIHNDDAAPVHLLGSSIIVEMAELASDSYVGANGAEQRGWQPVSAEELNLFPIGHAGNPGVFYSLANGSYDGVYDSGPDLGQADALVLKGNVDGKWTLAIAFRGTDNPNDVFDYVDFSLHYEKFKPLIDAVKSYVADPAHGIEQVLLTGHSLGGAMVQFAMNESFSGANAQGFTWGSPGAAISPPNPNIMNFEHQSDVVPIAGGIAGNHLVGTEVVLNDSLDDTPFDQLVSGVFAQHDMGFYVTDTSNLVRDSFSQSTAFYNTELASSLRSGIPWRGDSVLGSKVQIAVGTQSADTISISPSDSFVFANAGNDTINWSGGLISVLSHPPAVIDGGLGNDTLAFSAPSTGWSWHTSQSNSHETDLYLNNIPVAELFGIEHLKFIGSHFDLLT